MPDNEDICFYQYSQETALEALLPILRQYLPYSNPIYYRMQAPHNLPSRHCLFAATFPPPSSSLSQSIPRIFTVVFSDRSRYSETQIWVFNSVITAEYPKPLSISNAALLSAHLFKLLVFLKSIVIPEAPGHPFQPKLRFGCLHEAITTALLSLPSDPEKPLIPYATLWNLWLIPTSSNLQLSHTVPESFTTSRVVAAEHLDLVISTSSIPREASTLLLQPSLGLLTPTNDLVAWGFIGVDCTLATLYVLPEYRGRGLAKYIARELVGRLGRGDFRDLGFKGDTGWVHADVKAGNEGSEGVMKAIGGTIAWESSYLWVDSDAL